MRVEDLINLLNGVPSHYNVKSIRQFDCQDPEEYQIDESHFHKCDGNCTLEIEVAYEHCFLCGYAKELTKAKSVVCDLAEDKIKLVNEIKALEAKLKRKNLRIKQLVESK